MMNVGHRFDPDAENLERIRIMKTIYFDGLTKDKFFDTIFALIRASSIVELLMLTYLGIRRSNSNGKLTT